MDEHSSGFYSSCSSNKENQDQISFLLGLHRPPPTCSSYSSASAVGSSQPSHSREGGQMPHPSCYPIPGGGEDSGVVNEFGAVGSLGGDQDGFLPGGRRSVEPDLDSLDCESEEGLDVSEEPSKPTPARTSGSKRSRAAEVHNLSEKRRRSRINEKMKALQNLIPNSNKTDKASMLDEAIEYLKQLQLQVQMLSMRNGLNLHPLYLSGSLQPLQASQMLFGFGSDSDRTLNVGMSMLPPNQDAATQSSIGLSAQCTSRQSTTISGISTMANPETSFNARQSLQSDPECFHFPVTSEAIFTADFGRQQQQQLVSGHSARNLAENEMISMAVNKSRHIGGQASALISTGNLEEHMLARERSHEMRQKAHDGHFLIEQLQGLEQLRTFPGDDVKEESSEDI